MGPGDNTSSSGAGYSGASSSTNEAATGAGSGSTPFGGASGSGGQTASMGTSGGGTPPGTSGGGTPTGASGGGTPTGASGDASALTGASGGSASSAASSGGGPVSNVDGGASQTQSNDGGAGSAMREGGTGTAGTPAGGAACDIFASGGTPCVAAHSTVRALFSAYDGNLYQVTRASDQTTQDVGVLSPGGYAHSAVQDTFCAATTCTISIIYDQSGKANHLKQAPAGQRKATPDNLADATALKFTISGHTVYGVHLPVGSGYRVDSTAGVATGDEPETEYMVTSGTFFNAGCCFDYGNAETNDRDDGAATMEAVYFGNCSSWGKGSGSGPWVMADMENGLYAGPSFAASPTDTPLTSPYVTAMVIGRSGTFALKGGNAQMGTIATLYDGARPSGYNPMKKQGAIVLGVGGDQTSGAQGNFYEGVLTSGAASDAAVTAVQANIAAAGYGM